MFNGGTTGRGVAKPRRKTARRRRRWAETTANEAKDRPGWRLDNMYYGNIEDAQVQRVFLGRPLVFLRSLGAPTDAHGVTGRVYNPAALYVQTKARTHAYLWVYAASHPHGVLRASMSLILLRTHWTTNSGHPFKYQREIYLLKPAGAVLTIRWRWMSRKKRRSGRSTLLTRDAKGVRTVWRR